MFSFVTDDDERRLHSTANVKVPGHYKKGETEWFYTDIDLIHLAFINADKEYGGEKLLFHFSKMPVHDRKYTKLLDEFTKLFEFLFSYDFNQ